MEVDIQKQYAAVKGKIDEAKQRKADLSQNLAEEIIRAEKLAGEYEEKRDKAMQAGDFKTFAEMEGKRAAAQAQADFMRKQTGKNTETLSRKEADEIHSSIRKINYECSRVYGAKALAALDALEECCKMISDYVGMLNESLADVEGTLAPTEEYKTSGAIGITRLHTNADDILYELSPRGRMYEIVTRFRGECTGHAHL